MQCISLESICATCLFIRPSVRLLLCVFFYLVNNQHCSLLSTNDVKCYVVNKSSSSSFLYYFCVTSLKTSTSSLKTLVKLTIARQAKLISQLLAPYLISVQKLSKVDCRVCNTTENHGIFSTTFVFTIFRVESV